jgi:hypothetical protein
MIRAMMDGPDICVEVPPGDTLHRAAICTATLIVVGDAGSGMEPPLPLLVWAFSIFRSLGCVPEA